MKPFLRYSGGKRSTDRFLYTGILPWPRSPLLTEASKAGEMVIDLAEVSDCDSAFVALVTACLQIKQKQGQPLALTNSPRKFLEMLDVYGLADSGLQII